MQTPDDSAPLTASEIARSVRTREVSPFEIVDLAIARLKRANPTLNAFVHVDADCAREAARRVERRLTAGEEGGLIAGVPTAMADLFNTHPGWPSTMGGLPVLRGALAGTASLYGRRMEAAGAAMLGLTNSAPLGFSGACDNALFGPTRNPFDPSRNAGAAAGGSAAVVAAGIVPIAGAVDGGGWLRTSAACCGVFAFQSSHGVVGRPTRPSAFEAAPFAFDGAITRTVEDAALALEALAGFEPDDPFSRPTDVDWAGALSTGVAGKRIGLCLNLGGFPVTPAIAEVVVAAVMAFEAAGARVEPVALEFGSAPEGLVRLWRRLTATRMAGALAGLGRRGIDLRRDAPDDVPDEVWAAVDEVQTLTPLDLQRDNMARTAVYDKLQAALGRVDFIASPTVGTLPVANVPDGRTRGPATVAGCPVDTVAGWCPGFLTNLTGHPAASLPAGLAGGLPVGLHLIGRRQRDYELLAACAAFEAARPWVGSYAAVAASALPLPEPECLSAEVAA